MGNGFDFDGTNAPSAQAPDGSGGIGPAGGRGTAPPGVAGAPGVPGMPGMPGISGVPGPAGFGGYAGPGGYAGYPGYDDYDEDDGYGGASHPAIQWGLICGIALAVAMILPFVVLEIAYPTFLSHPDMASQSIAAKPDLGASLALVVVTLAGIVVTPVALFLAGFMTTRETGTVESGAFAGGLGGFIAYLVYIFGSVFLTVVQHATISWDEVPGAYHLLLGVTLGGSFLATSMCALFVFIVPAAVVATLGAGLARLIWGPA